MSSMSALLLTVHSGTCGPTASPALCLSHVSVAAELPGGYVAPASLKGSPLHLYPALTSAQIPGRGPWSQAASLEEKGLQSCYRKRRSTVLGCVLCDTHRPQFTLYPTQQTGVPGSHTHLSLRGMKAQLCIWSRLSF